MSGKSNKKKRKEDQIQDEKAPKRSGAQGKTPASIAEKAKAAKASALSREDVYKKSPFAKLYDKVNPGDYTIKQDLHHTIFIFVFLLVVILLAATMAFVNQAHERDLRSAKLYIPSRTFVAGQEDNVTNMLSDQGFVDIDSDDDGDIIAYGTADMVQSYKDSYYSKNIEQYEKKLDKGVYGAGVESITVSDDAKTMTLYTLGDMAESSIALSNCVENEDLNSIIKAYSTWCGLRNEGAEMTIDFINVLDLSDGADGTKYWSSTRANGGQMVADKEQEEKAAAEAANAEEQGE